MALKFKFRPEDLGWMLLVGAATLFGNGTPFGNPVTEELPRALVYNVLQFGVPAVLLVRLADAFVDAGRVPAWLAYPAVVIGTIVLGVWVIAPALYPVLGKVDWWNSSNDIELAGTSSVWHALGMTIYVQLRSAHRAQAHLKALQTAAADRQRQLAAAQLLALQARVDPALLSRHLAIIDTELAREPLRAQARLAALIELLRAMQPHLEAEISTLAREVVALRAYARLISADAQHTERLHLIHLAEPPAWPLAPMVLLPLARALLDDDGTIWALSLHHNPDTDAGHAELRLQALGPDPEHTQRTAARAPLVELAQRLQAVHGVQASLELTVDPLPLFKLRWPVLSTTSAL